jgi:hypothetical protein
VGYDPEGPGLRCPKCGSAQDAGITVCDLCGIVFAKYRGARPLQAVARAAGAGTLPLAGRGLLWAALLLWGGRLMLSSVESGAVGGSFLHLVNLPFHEAGHVAFAPFGDFVRSLGGTLGQLLMPLVCAGTLLLKTRDPFGAAVALWWFGENLLDIAPYIDDARTLDLPLLGGNYGHSAPYGFHDWNYLLTESGLLFRDHELARASHSIGCLVMLLALAWGGLVLWRSYRRSGWL